MVTEAALRAAVAVAYAQSEACRCLRHTQDTERAVEALRAWLYTPLTPAEMNNRGTPTHWTETR